MATLYWKGHAPAAMQVTTITPGGTVPNETFTISVGDVDLTYVAGASDTATDIAQALSDLWNNSTHAYHTSITASQNSDQVSLMSDIAGIPFVISGSASASATLTINTPTSNSGPHDWATASNWSTGTLPGDGDVVIFEHNGVPVLFGLNQSTVTLAALHIKQSYTGKIGLDDAVFHIDSDTLDPSQCEYRQTYLTIGVESIHIGEHTGQNIASGSSRIKIDTGSIQTLLHVHNTSSTSSDTHQQVVRWKGTHIDNVVRIVRGKLGIASNLPGESTSLSALYVGQADSLGSDASVVLGPGVTLTNLYQAGGTVWSSCDVDTIEQTAGMLNTLGTLSLNNVTLWGKAEFQHVGNITNLILGHAAEADFSHHPTLRTIEHCQMHHAATLNLNNGNPLSISFTNGINCMQTSPENVTIKWWPNVKLNVSAIV